ncbi:unnamed protein product, partial [Symbiodinium sp. KB8]
MGLVWVIRALIRKLGTLVYWAQRAAGGVPEAAGADFIGPGTGRIPETADLRLFKSTAGVDKWALVRREGHVAVFKIGADNQTIRSPGLFVPIEADTLRGSPCVVDACRGVDKVHLCRHLVCSEEGQHFKEYAVARDFDAEKFHLKTSELEATKAGKTLWAWLWSTSTRPAERAREFGSESETDTKPCGAHRVKWVDRDGDHRLAGAPCKLGGTNVCPLLVEDRLDEAGEVAMCPQHAFDYERKRRVQQCFAENFVSEEIPGEEIKRLLDDIRTEVGAAKKARDKSPGGTPKASIQKNLAKLGLLDSPQRDHPLSILEEFFNQFAEGKEMGLTEEGVRANLAMERGMSLKEITQGLLKQALEEQAK